MKLTTERYKKLIFISTVLNLFALLVNKFEIYGKLGNYFRLFTYYHFMADKGLWPFVKIIQINDYPGHPTWIEFNGIFYHYDISAFLLYMGILAAFLIYKAYITKKNVRIK